jgi:alkaline phosphatase
MSKANLSYNPDAYFLTKLGGKEPATDSASAATAMSTGYKTDDGNIAWLPGDLPGDNLTTIAEQLRVDKGFSIGVVSTVPFNHATPAAFVSHNISRNNYAPGRLDSANPMPSDYRSNIAEEILLDVQPDVVIGGGYDTTYVAGLDFSTLPSDYVQVFRDLNEDGGESLADVAEELESGGKLFGLFGTPDGNFEYFTVANDPGNPSMTRGSATYSVTPNGIESDDESEDESDDDDGIDPDPTLKEATLAAISVLNQDPDGFFVICEQGDIDWSNHANDFENMIGGIWDLDQAVRAAEAMVNSGEGGLNWRNTLMIVTADHSNSYMRNQQWLGAGELPTQDGTNYPDGEVTYGTGNHTNEPVTVSARGAGAKLFNQYAGSWYPGTKLVDNTQIYEVMMEAAKQGVEHIILFIGDGMNIEHEIAGSNYLYGEPNQLAWQDWGKLPNGYEGFATTWDVTTYNKYASANGLPNYDPDNFDPLVGYNPALGGDYEVIEGTDKKDRLSSPGGPYPKTSFVFAGKGNDHIFSGDGDDLIYGGKGNDKLDGEEGKDRLCGGPGSDIFVLTPDSGQDSICDFELRDSIGLSGGIDFDDLSFSGSDIILTSTGETLATLAGVDATTLTRADFIIL